MEKMKYKAPQARDLSGFGASGQGPLYNCVSGLIAQAPGNCSQGAMPDPAACTGGMFVQGSDCSGGYAFDQPVPCTAGGSATAECVTGGSATNQLCTSGGVP